MLSRETNPLFSQLHPELPIRHIPGPVNMLFEGYVWLLVDRIRDPFESCFVSPYQDDFRRASVGVILRDGEANAARGACHDDCFALERVGRDTMGDVLEGAFRGCDVDCWGGVSTEWEVEHCPYNGMYQYYLASSDESSQSHRLTLSISSLACGIRVKVCGHVTTRFDWRRSRRRSMRVLKSRNH